MNKFHIALTFMLSTTASFSQTLFYTAIGMSAVQLRNKGDLSSGEPMFLKATYKPAFEIGLGKKISNYILLSSGLSYSQRGQDYLFKQHQAPSWEYSFCSYDINAYTNLNYISVPVGITFFSKNDNRIISPFIGLSAYMAYLVTYKDYYSIKNNYPPIDPMTQQLLGIEWNDYYTFEDDKLSWQSMYFSEARTYKLDSWLYNRFDWGFGISAGAQFTLTNNLLFKVEATVNRGMTDVEFEGNISGYDSEHGLILSKLGFKQKDFVKYNTGTSYSVFRDRTTATYNQSLGLRVHFIYKKK